MWLSGRVRGCVWRGTGSNPAVDTFLTRRTVIWVYTCAFVSESYEYTLIFFMELMLPPQICVNSPFSHCSFLFFFFPTVWSLPTFFYYLFFLFFCVKETLLFFILVPRFTWIVYFEIKTISQFCFLFRFLFLNCKFSLTFSADTIKFWWQFLFRLTKKKLNEFSIT